MQAKDILNNNDKLLDALKRFPLEQLVDADQEFISAMKVRYRGKEKLLPNHAMLLKIKLKKYEHVLLHLPEEEVIPDVVKDVPTAVLYRKTVRMKFKEGTPEIRDFVRRTRACEYRSTLDCWSAPLNIGTVEELLLLGFELDTLLRKWYDENTTDVVDDKTGNKTLDRLLRKYQRIGVNFLLSRDGKALLADDMGLGKTIQVLGYLIMNEDALPATVVCPSSVKRKWAREITKWTNYTVHVMEGRYTKENETPDADIIILNYDIVAVAEERKKVKGEKAVKKAKNEPVMPRPDLGEFPTLILDEAHKISNQKSQRTQAIIQLAKGCERVLGMSGTPIKNKPFEFWTILQLINKQAVPDFWTYVQTYCDAKKNRFGWDFSGSSNTQELHERLTKTIMLRRLKADVDIDLPAKIRSVIPLDWDRRVYLQEQENYRLWMLQNGKDIASQNGFAKIEHLKQAAVKAKMKDALLWVNEFFEESQKLVIFTRHIFTIDILKKELSKYKPIVLDGSVASHKRQPLIDIFQTSDKCRLAIVNMSAGGEGVEFTAADAVAFMEIGWTSAEHDQCEDRVHRFGKVGDVVCYYLVADGTIEDKLIEMIDKKREIVSGVVDGAGASDKEMLAELVGAYFDDLKQSKGK